MTNLIVGVDVSKAYLDLADTRGGAPRRVANESTAIAELIANLRTDAPELVVLEATGGYETALVIALQGAGLAVAVVFYLYRPDIPEELAHQHGVLYRFLLNKWYFDELYDFLFVRPAKRLGRFLWKVGDGMIIDGLGPDGISKRVLDVTRGAVRLQSGYVYHYAFAMLVGVAALVTWFLFSKGAV